MTTIAPISTNVEQTKPNFKGMETSQSGVPYYKTNAGLISGAVVAVIPTISRLKKLGISDSAIGSLKQDSNVVEGLLSDFAKYQAEFMERSKKYAIPLALLTAAIYTIPGAAVDYIRNKKAEEAADSIGEKGLERAFIENSNIQIQPYGLPYYKSDVGKKYGALFGAAAGLVNFATSCTKSLPYKSRYAVMSVLSNALGGFIMGSIADYFSNKATEKSASPRF